ncbi:MAG: SDR family oxidoreductase [Psychromonas sp.]|nr:SDR family oxidoreductase [Psychromonas sp.]
MKTALITGASGGIGKSFAEIFAQQGYNLILVARSKDKLEQLSDKYEQDYGIVVTVFSVDLSRQNAATEIYSEIQKRKIRIDILINNAGFGDHGRFIVSSLSKTRNMINLNILTLTELTSIFIKEMMKNRDGKILNIASTASFQPLPRFAVYAASKSYVLNFTEALHYELKGSGVSVSVLCPGPTATEFEKSANIKDSNLFKGKLMDPQRVAKIGYDGLMKGKMTIIPGFKNKLLAFFANMMPSRDLLVWISSKIS